MMRSWRVLVLFIAGLFLMTDTAFAGLNFIRGKAFTVSTKPEFFAVGDFDGDGKADVAVTSQQSAELNILLGTGDWSFNQGVVQRFGQRLSGIAVGDLNGDQLADIAVADEASKGVHILLGNGDGTVRYHQLVTVGRTPTAVAIGDFDKKTGNDLVVADRTGNKVFILLNDGNPQPVFRGGGDHSTGDASGPQEIVIADLDGDGNVDIATLNLGGPRVKDIGVLYFDRVSTTGFPAFAAVQRFGIGERPESLIVADLNDDGLSDLAVINRPLGQLTSKVQIRVARTDRFLDVGQEFTIPCPFFAGDLGCRARALAAADFDGDEDIDLVVALEDPRPTEPGDAVQIYANRGDGFFFSGPVYSTNNNQTAAEVGDVDGDGRPDVIVASAQLLTMETLGNVSSFGDGAQGTDCGTNQECLSNVCFDGVCCNSVCRTDERCDIPGTTKGICTPVLPPVECEEANECEPPLGQDDGFCINGFCCNEECSDGVCDVPEFEGVCVHRLPQGDECEFDEDCASTFCVDGVCCNRACDEDERCNLPDTVGTCVPAAANGAPCAEDIECASGICDFTEPRICCNRECTEDEFCNPAGNCTPFEVVPTLPPNATGTPVATATPGPAGSECSSTSQCGVNTCVNFVCCTTPTCPDGQFCDATRGGTCQVGTPPPTPTPTPTRTPVPPRPTNTPDDGTCGGEQCGGPCCGDQICCAGGTCDGSTCVLTSSSGGCAIDRSSQSTGNGLLVLTLIPAALWIARRALMPRPAMVRVRPRR